MLKSLTTGARSVAGPAPAGDVGCDWFKAEFSIGPESKEFYHDVVWCKIFTSRDLQGFAASVRLPPGV